MSKEKGRPRRQTTENAPNADTSQTEFGSQLTVNGGLDVTACVFRVATIVLSPATLAVNVAVYVPSPWSTRLVNIPCPTPLPTANVTVAPPVVYAWPLASLAVNVTVAVVVFGTVDGVMVTVDWVGSAGPITVTGGAVVVTG